MKAFRDKKHVLQRETTSYPACNSQSSAEELARCNEVTRRSIAETIQQVENRISPGRVFDNVWEYIRQNLVDPRSLQHTIKKNPAPFVAVGVGLLLGGAALAGYSFYRMRSEKRGYGRHARLPAARWETEPEMAQLEAEAVIPPHQPVEPARTRIEEEASTEDIISEEELEKPYKPF